MKRTSISFVSAIRSCLCTSATITTSLCAKASNRTTFEHDNRQPVLSKGRLPCFIATRAPCSNEQSASSEHPVRASKKRYRLCPRWYGLFRFYPTGRYPRCRKAAYQEWLGICPSVFISSYVAPGHCEPPILHEFSKAARTDSSGSSAGAGGCRPPHRSAKCAAGCFAGCGCAVRSASAGG